MPSQSLCFIFPRYNNTEIVILIVLEKYILEIGGSKNLRGANFNGNKVHIFIRIL